MNRIGRSDSSESGHITSSCGRASRGTPLGRWHAPVGYWALWAERVLLSRPYGRGRGDMIVRRCADVADGKSQLPAGEGGSSWLPASGAGSLVGRRHPNRASAGTLQRCKAFG